MANAYQQKMKAASIARGFNESRITQER